ncbi:MAG: adenylyltransferase/cytidyltransferase family protein [Chlamydiia bacterium]|nr:adenylyltransferase/cytidyltransferase family protein [Chlamydiia bacterium]
MKKLALFLLLFVSVYAKQVRVYVDIVGDLFHAGHVQFFQKARAEGDYLIVGIHGDETCTNYKRKPILSLEERRIAIEACRYVDEVIVNVPIGITEEWIKKYDIDLVIHGDDFSEVNKNIHYGVPIRMGIFKTVPYTQGISTTDIIKRVISRADS